MTFIINYGMLQDPLCEVLQTWIVQISITGKDKGFSQSYRCKSCVWPNNSAKLRVLWSIATQVDFSSCKEDFIMSWSLFKQYKWKLKKFHRNSISHVHVRKCLNNDTCKNFQGYFELQQHKTQTGNSQGLIRLLSIKSEYRKALSSPPPLLNPPLWAKFLNAPSVWKSHCHPGSFTHREEGNKKQS